MGNARSDRNPLDAAILPAAVFLFGAIIWFLVIARSHFRLEDALITFRYSANIIRGNGFVFNPGERVLGTTTPLETLLLAALSLPFGYQALPTVAAIIMSLFGLFSGVVAYFAMTKRGIAAPAAALGMLMLYCHIETIRTGIGGMETPLVLLLMALSLCGLISRKPVATGVFLGLLALTRPDGLIWTGLLFASTLLTVQGSRKDLRPGQSTFKYLAFQTIAFVAVILPWIVFATIYFGNPIPNSVLAKGAVRPGEAVSLSNPHRIADYARWYLVGTGVKWNGPLILFWLAAFAAGTLRLLKQSPKELGLIVIFPPVYALVMYMGHSPRFEWYLLPLTFMCILVAAVGVYELVRLFGESVLRLNSKAVRTVEVALVAAVAIFFLCNGLSLMIGRMYRAQRNEDGLRTKVGLWLKANTPADATVAMEAIGYQGYYSDLRIIDLAGLVSPQVVGYMKRTGENGQVFDWILNDLKPDYIVLRSFEVDTNHHFNGGKLFLTPQKEAAFHSTYAEARRFAAPYHGSSKRVRFLTIYRRLPKT